MHKDVLMNMQVALSVTLFRQVLATTVDGATLRRKIATKDRVVTTRVFPTHRGASMLVGILYHALAITKSYYYNCM